MRRMRTGRDAAPEGSASPAGPPGASGDTARPNYMGPSGLVGADESGGKPRELRAFRMGAPVRFQKAVPRTKEKRRGEAPIGAPVRVMGRLFPSAEGTGFAARRATGCGVPHQRLSERRPPRMGGIPRQRPGARFPGTMEPVSMNHDERQPAAPRALLDRTTCNQPVMPRQRVRPLAGPMTGSGGASSNDGLAITGSPAFAGDDSRGFWRNEPESSGDVLAKRTRGLRAATNLALHMGLSGLSHYAFYLGIFCARLMGSYNGVAKYSVFQRRIAEMSLARGLRCRACADPGRGSGACV